MTTNNIAIEKSNNPSVDGYDITYNGYPYHVHPILTPDVWKIFAEDLADGKYKIQKYVPEKIKEVPPQKPLTAQEKLEKSGLTVDELKQLLGLK